jgi:two-component system, NarL family, sensor histidine kinase EvgS
MINIWEGKFPCNQKIFLGVVLLLVYFLPFRLSAKEFRILTEEFPPYNYTQNNEVVGISTEIMREMLKRLGHSDNFEVMPWSKAYHIAQEEDNIILFSTTRTPIREKLFKWVGPLVPNNTMFFAKKDSDISLTSLDDAKKVARIGVYKDDFGELLLREKGFDNLESVLDNKENVIKLAKGEIDLWIINDLTGRHMARGEGLSDHIKKVFEVQKDYMYIAFSKTTPDEVVRKWQNVLDEIKSDGSYGQIFANWVMFSYSDDLKPKITKALSLSEEEKAWTKAHPVIRVAPDPDYAPFQYTDLNGNSQGLANDYLILIEKKLGIRFDMVPTESWNKSLESVKAHSADMVVVAAKTASREKYLSFTSPYVVFPDVIITRKNGPKINSIVELHGKTLATIKGFAINDYIRKYYPKIKLLFKPDIKSVLNSISIGEFDAAVINIATASHVIEKNNITNLRVDGETGFTYKLSFASRKDWPLLNSLLEKALNTISIEERKELLRKWISISYTSSEAKKDDHRVKLTDEEKAWLENHPVLTVAPDPMWAPVEFFDEDGKFSGITAEYIALLEDRIGIKFHILHLDSWKEILQKARDGKIDVLTAASKTPSRERDLIFSKAYLNFPSVIIVHKKETGRLSIDDLKGKVVAVVSGYANQEYLASAFPEIHLELVSSVKEGLRQVSYGKAFAFVGNIATASYIMEKDVMLNLRVAGDGGFSWNLSLASHIGSPILNRILSKGLASITKEERQEIFSRWIIIAKESWKPSRELIIGIIVTLVTLFIVSIIVWNRLLSRKVDQRTIELNKTLDESEKLRQKADQAQQEAERANRAKSEFLANMSHELRTPMNSVLGFTELLETLLKDKKQISYLQAIKTGGKSLLTLVNDILDLSKIEAGKMEVQYRPTSLAELVNEIQQIFSLAMTQKDLMFEQRIASHLPPRLLLDEIRLRQVLFNLVGNAIKFTEKGVIILSINTETALKENEELELVIAVEDSGIGISEKDCAQIFESFQQQESQDTRKFGGTGLGLTISKRLVELMNGSLTVSSEVGQGSVFELRLRNVAIPALDETAISLAIKTIPQVKFKPATIMIVDDVEPNRTLIAEIFLRSPIKILEAQNGKEAVESAHKYNPDLILMDLLMPDMDGYHALKQLRLDKKTQTIPVIALTASVVVDVEELVDNHGFDGCLFKPISRNDLLQELMRFLKYTPLSENQLHDVEKNENQQVDVELLPDELLIQIPKILQVLEQEFLPQWENFQVLQPAKEVKRFGEGIKALGDDINFQLLVEYGKELLEHLDHIDIINIRKTLSQFPKLIQQLHAQSDNENK